MNTIPDLTSVSFHPSIFQKRENNVKREYRTLAEAEKSRSILVDTKIRSDYPLTSMDHYETPYNDVLRGIQELGPFSRAFFSKENIKWIQSNIRFGVYKYSDKKHIISNQDETNLIIVMRAIYLQNSDNPNDSRKYRKEILRLNNLVLDKVIPDIISELEQYKGYLRDIESIPEPLTLPVHSSITGTKGKDSRGFSDILGIDPYL